MNPAYEIRISDAQRQLLILALDVAANGDRAPFHGDEWEEVSMLKGMLDDAKVTESFADPIMNDFTA